jgi:hypothetical protein
MFSIEPFPNPAMGFDIKLLVFLARSRGPQASLCSDNNLLLLDLVQSVFEIYLELFELKILSRDPHTSVHSL